MPRFQVRKTEIYTLDLDAADEAEALLLAEETPEYDWHQGDGPEYEATKLGD